MKKSKYRNSLRTTDERQRRLILIELGIQVWRPHKALLTTVFRFAPDGRELRVTFCHANDRRKFLQEQRKTLKEMRDRTSPDALKNLKWMEKE